MKRLLSLCVLITSCPAALIAAEGPVPKGVSHADHVLVILMENHGYNQLVGNPNAPFDKLS
jgi:hypothetical protein